MADQQEQMARGLAPRTVLHFADEKGVCEAAAQAVLLQVIRLQAEQERVDLAVTGGGDGIEMLRRMDLSPLVSSVDWLRVHFWWGDERFVAADDPDRNALQARHALLNDLEANHGLPEANIHEMPADLRTASQRQTDGADADRRSVDEAARDYQKELESLPNRTLEGVPSFDIAWFGVGPDAHMASLMPMLPEVLSNDPGKLVCGVTNSPNLPPLRISLTVPMIQASREVWVIASSERKQTAMARVLGQATIQGGRVVYPNADFDDPSAPVSFAAGREQTLWFVDRMASPVWGWKIN